MGGQIHYATTIRDIFGVSENEKPPLGIPPEFEKEEDNKPVAKAKVNAGWAEEHRDKAKKSASTQYASGQVRLQLRSSSLYLND
ncbi:hypothetical protein [Shewanella sp. TB4-MNA-CIBAN-0142]|uniref:hypothetical protein n=1 Tax=Shewanella sp. TB4-MNA-CIBAN-0142 TaxID=3140464 RepID=UPI00331E123C